MPAVGQLLVSEKGRRCEESGKVNFEKEKQKESVGTIIMLQHMKQAQQQHSSISSSCCRAEGAASAIPRIHDEYPRRDTTSWPTGNLLLVQSAPHHLLLPCTWLASASGGQKTVSSPATRPLQRSMHRYLVTRGASHRMRTGASQRPNQCLLLYGNTWSIDNTQSCTSSFL